MMNKIVSIFLLCAAAFAIQAPAFAQTSSDDQAEEVRRLLEERDQEIKSVLGDREEFTAEQRERLKTVINEGIDFEAMGRVALGPHWSEITPARQSEFTDVFSRIVRTQSLSNLDVYRSEVTFQDVTVEGDSARALTTTVYDGVPTQVEYVLGLEGDRWRVHDIILDDVSTAEGYARSFQTVIRRRGFDALMESLRNKLESMSS